MKLEIIFKLITRNNKISFNYKRKIASLFYELIRRKDDNFAKELHDKNSISDYSISDINFKSGLRINRNFGYIIRGKHFSIEISTFNKKIIQILKKIKNERFSLTDKMNNLWFKVDDIKILDIKSSLSDDKRFLCNSFCLLKKFEDKSYKISYTPSEFESKEFKKAFFENLIRKFENITNSKKSFDVSKMDLKIFTKKEKIEKYSFSKGETNIKYYSIEFQLNCPDELKKVAYINGIGNYNKNLFGYVHIIK